MPIDVTLEQSPPTVVLTPSHPAPTVKSLSEASTAAKAALEQAAKANPHLAGADPRIEWRSPAAAAPEDVDWKNWARHYDTIAWQVTSIFTAGSVLLANGYVNGRLNDADLPMLRAIAGCSIGLILFQMFVVGAFRTYRYELYRAEHRRDPHSPALATFRQWSGTPWLVYCVVAWLAAMLWTYQFTYLASPWFEWTLAIGTATTLLLAAIGYWATPPTFRT